MIDISVAGKMTKVPSICPYRDVNIGFPSKSAFKRTSKVLHFPCDVEEPATAGRVRRTPSFNGHGSFIMRRGWRTPDEAQAPAQQRKKHLDIHSGQSSKMIGMCLLQIESKTWYLYPSSARHAILGVANLGMCMFLVQNGPLLRSLLLQ